MLPHEVISHLYHTNILLFSELYIGDSSDEDTWRMQLEQFWYTVQARHDPRIFQHPMKAVRQWQTKFVPLSLHGDGVPVTTFGKAGSKSMDVYSTSGLLGVGTTRALTLYTFGLFTNTEIKQDRATMTKIWQTVVWSLKAAYDGHVPTHDEDGNPLRGEKVGKPLAGGLRFVMWSLKADLDH